MIPCDCDCALFQILAVFDVFLGSIAVWFQDEQSLPPYLMDGTKLEDQLNAGHDAQIVQTVLFTDVARQFATCLMDRSNQQLIEKVKRAFRSFSE